MWLGSIRSEDLDTLERVFAVLTPEGWVLPEWLVWLRQQVEKM